MPDRFVLCCNDATLRELIRPRALFCRGERVTRRWLAAHPWAVDLPRFRLVTAEELRSRRAQRGRVGAGLKLFDLDDGGWSGFAPGGDDVATNVLARLQVSSATRELDAGHPQRINAVVEAARAIAAVVQGPIWEVEHDGGLELAIGTALAHGRAVAYGAGGPGLLAASLSSVWGVSVRTHLDIESTRRLLGA